MTTNPNNAAQPMLTDEEIMRSAINASDSLNITRLHEMGAPSRTIMEDAGLLELGRAIESALLSKLRAPVADERAAFIEWLTVSYPNAYSEPEAVRLWHHGHVSALAWKERGRRAALASAPAPFDRRQLRALVDLVWNEATESTAVPDTPWADRMIDKVFSSLPASAAVAGEAKNYPGDDVAERLDNMADDQPPGSQAQSDLYAAATIWRKHITHRAAPQASECECARKSKAVADSEAEL